MTPPVEMSVAPEEVGRGLVGTLEAGYLSPGQSTGWTYNVNNPQNLQFQLEFVGDPYCSVIATPVINTTPVYGWVTTTVWHPVQIAYS